MRLDEIRAVVAAFADAAARCKQAGADAVQIHAAHGFLLSAFLNPYFNKRTDAYGGNIECRARIVLEVYAAVRKAVGNEYPVWIKINCKDLTEPSINPTEFQWVCSELDKRCMDAIEVSGGAMISPQSAPAPLINKEEDEGYFAREALQVAGTVSASVISVCGYRTPDMIETWLNQGKIEAISLCRPLICEPDLVGRWERGDRKKARCVSCSKCFNPELQCKAFSEKATNGET
jgi:2,4-dienoyl-CoA reductase-like NADH-dependent reductase (Old Yellow Enzyme family)